MESKYIEDVFEDYLKTKETNYSILINGSWGSGKTYFWKTTLIDLCKKDNFKPIYLSLNGINKIETLDYQLKIKFIPFLNKLDVKKSANVTTLVKNAINVFVKEKWSIDPESIIKDVEIDLTLFSKNVVCFDDLERCKIPLSEVLGYVNDFVEHKNLKVVFLSDESKINTASDEKYNSIKEKVIGRILNFKNSLIDTLPFLFEKYKTNDAEFYSFLLSKKENIHDLLVEYKEENLRNIVFFIDVLSKVYVVGKTHNDYLDEVSLFALIITIEFKTGKLTSNDYQNFKGYENINSAFALFNFSSPDRRNFWNEKINENEQPKSDLEFFYDKYLTNNINSYFFYPSIYQFVLTGYLDKIKLTDELKSRYPEVVPNEVIAFRDLLNHGFRKLPNAKFNELFDEVLEYSKKGKYVIYDYLQISRFFNFFSKNKLIKLSIEEIEEALKEGFEISRQREENDVVLFESIFHFNNNDDDKVICDLIKEAHNAIELKKENEKVNKLILVLKENDCKSIGKMFDEYKVRKELFEHLRSKELFEVLINIENIALTEFKFQLDNRYTSVNIKDYLSSDYDFLDELNNFVIEYLQEKTEYSIQDFLLKEISDKIGEICKKIK